MISSIIVDPRSQRQESLKTYLSEYCPYIAIKGIAQNIQQANKLFDQFRPELLFFESHAGLEPVGEFDCKAFPADIEIILLTSQAIRTSISQRIIAGCLPRPIQTMDLILAVNNALNRILERRKSTQQSLIQKFFRVHTLEEIVGIPTMEGFEFIPINSIIRCEGLQKCTRVVSCEHSNIVSSYNLGEFKKLLEPFGFFAPHKSHLINLNRIKRYHKEGTILMKDGSSVPVARRRKEYFLQIINRL